MNSENIVIQLKILQMAVNTMLWNTPLANA